jgi:hypothetical protein
VFSGDFRVDGDGNVAAVYVVVFIHNSKACPTSLLVGAYQFSSSVFRPMLSQQ